MQVQRLYDGTPPSLPRRYEKRTVTQLGLPSVPPTETNRLDGYVYKSRILRDYLSSPSHR